MIDIDTLAAFVKVLAEHKPTEGLTDDWLRGYDAALSMVAALARDTLDLAQKYGKEIKIEGDLNDTF